MQQLGAAIAAGIGPSLTPTVTPPPGTSFACISFRFLLFFPVEEPEKGALRAALIARIEAAEKRAETSEATYAGRSEALAAELAVIRSDQRADASVREERHHELIVSGDKTQRAILEGWGGSNPALADALTELRAGVKDEGKANRENSLMIATMFKEALAEHTQGQTLAMGKFLNYIQAKDSRTSDSERQFVEFLRDKVETVSQQQNQLQNISSRQEGIALAMVDQGYMGRNMERALTDRSYLATGPLERRSPRATPLRRGSSHSSRLGVFKEQQEEEDEEDEEEDFTQDPDFQAMLAEYKKNKKAKKGKKE
jgi:hypothetical protein